MDLYEFSKNLKPLESYFKLVLDCYYNKNGDPIIIDYMKPYMSSENHKIFEKNVLSLHKKYIELQNLNMEILRLQNENIKLLLEQYQK